MEKRIKPYILILFCLMSFTSSEAGAESSSIKDIDELAAIVSKRTSSIDNIQFKFSQNTYIADSTQTVKAEVFFKKPEKLAVFYEEPIRQEVYINNGYLYTYIPEIRQATKHKNDSFTDILGKTISIILSDDPFKMLRKDFNLEYLHNDDDMYYQIKAIPKQKDAIDEIIIYFNKQLLLPEKTVVSSNNFKSVTFFKDYILNGSIENTVFDFITESDIKIITIE